MKHKLLMIGIVSMLASNTAMAYDIGYNYDNVADEVVISGSLDDGKERISLQVYDKEAFDTYAPDGVTNRENIDDILVFSAQGYTDETGGFKFSFPLKEASGSYIARIGAYSLEKGIDYKFYYTEPGEEGGILENLKKKKTAKELMEYVEGETPEAIEVFNPDPAYAGIENKLAVYKLILESESFETISEFSSIFSVATRIQEINEIEDEDALIEKLLEYNKLSEVADTIFYTKTYSQTLNEEQKKQTLKKVINHSDFTSFNEITRYFGEQVIISAISNNYWNIADEVLNDNESFFSDEIRKDCLGTQLKREKAAKAVAGESFSDFSALEKMITTAFKKPSGNNTGGGSSGGMSSSSSGGSGGFVQMPVVTPVQTVEEMKMPFDDISGFGWAETAIESLWKKSVISGVSEKEFMPGKEVTREEFVAMVVRNFGLLNKNAKCDFDDIPENDWCYSAVASAYEKGIVYGVDEHTFGKGTKITRQDMCVIASRAAEAAGVTFYETAELAFRDEISDYAIDKIKAFYANGIISGLSEDMFGAFEYSNRAQAAVVIYKINEYMKQ